MKYIYVAYVESFICCQADWIGVGQAEWLTGSGEPGRVNRAG